MSAFVPFVEHGRDAAFPVPAPWAVYVTVTPGAEEDHLQEPEEQEENGEADAAERKETEVMRVSKTVWVITITVAGTNHGWNSLPVFGGLRDGGCHCGSLRDSLRDPGLVGHESAYGHESDQQQDSDQAKYKTVTKHFYLQWVIDLVCSFAPVSIHCGGIMDERVKDCGSCVNEVSELLLSFCECQPYSETDKDAACETLQELSVIGSAR